MMDRDQAVEHLRSKASALQAKGATALYLFGSTARGEARQGSDIDVFIDYDVQSRFNAFDLVGLKLFLEQSLGVPVDITTRDGLHPILRPGIEREALRVF